MRRKFGSNFKSRNQGSSKGQLPDCALLVVPFSRQTRLELLHRGRDPTLLLIESPSRDPIKEFWELDLNKSLVCRR
jgi:hypothetical protein